MGGCDDLEETDFEQFLLSEWCGGLERTNFEQFLLSEGAVLGCGGVVALKGCDFEQFLLSEGVVVLKGLILNSFYFQREWWS